MNRLDVFDEVAFYVDERDIQNGEEILISLDGRDICKAVVKRDGDEIEFKVIAIR